MRTFSLLLAAAVLVTACGDKPAQEVEETPPSLVEVFPNLPLPPGGMLLSREGAGAAMQMTFSSPLLGDSIAEYYREVLSAPPYELMNESINNGVVSFFVEQNGPSMWVVVQGLEAGGSLVTVAGARARRGTGADSVRVLEGKPVNPDSLPGTALPLN
jgi:hypothetical protein